MIDILIGILLLIGSAFFLVSSIGLLRLPDVYMRASATAKAVTLGMGCLLLALVLHFKDTEASALAFLVMLFFGITAPVGAHMMGRASYLAGSPLWKQTKHDDLAGHYDPSSYRRGARDFLARLLDVGAPLQQKKTGIELEQSSEGGGEAELVEIMVPYNAEAAGKPIYELNLPPDCLITVVGKDEKFVVASGKTVLAGGDVILVLANHENREALRAIFNKIKHEDPEKPPAAGA